MTTHPRSLILLAALACTLASTVYGQDAPKPPTTTPDSQEGPTTGNDGIILLNAIQFSTKHYKEASESTKELFQDDK